MSPLNRRDFLKTASAATLGALAAREPRLSAEELEKIAPRADCIIVLWMAGGMAHTETFDPKRYTAFEKGVESKAVLSTFPSIPTAVDGVRFSAGLEKMAAVMDRGTLIRTAQAADLGFILHSRHQYHWHTGYVPPQSVAAPHLGAFIGEGARAARSGDAGVHQHRPAVRPRRRRGAEGIHDRGISRERIRAVQHSLPAGRRRPRCGRPRG